MRSCLTLILLLGLVSHCLAAASSGPAVIHRGHENECFVSKINGYLRPGTKKYLTNCAVVECKERDGELFESFLSCGVVILPSSCRLVPPGRFDVYPKCCPRYDCREAVAL